MFLGDWAAISAVMARLISHQPIVAPLNNSPWHKINWGFAFGNQRICTQFWIESGRSLLQDNGVCARIDYWNVFPMKRRHFGKVGAVTALLPRLILVLVHNGYHSGEISTYSDPMHNKFYISIVLKLNPNCIGNSLDYQDHLFPVGHCTDFFTLQFYSIPCCTDNEKIICHIKLYLAVWSMYNYNIFTEIRQRVKWLGNGSFHFVILLKEDVCKN